MRAVDREQTSPEVEDEVGNGGGGVVMMLLVVVVVVEVVVAVADYVGDRGCGGCGGRLCWW